jgi:hypothetical protein
VRMVRILPLAVIALHKAQPRQLILLVIIP